MARDPACAPFWHHVGCVDAETEETKDSNHQKAKACCHHGRMPIVTTSAFWDDRKNMSTMDDPQKKSPWSTGFVHPMVHWFIRFRPFFP
jgi:hypothetical protein